MINRSTDESYAQYETLLIERDGDVLIITINRPDHENACDDVMHTELSTIFTEVRADPAKAIVLTGAGDFFLNTGDFDWFLTIEEDEWLRVMRENKWIMHDIMSVPQPIVVALNGPAMGLGATLVSFGDVVIAAEEARLGDHHAGFGVVSGDGGALLFPFSMGLLQAKQLYLMNKEFTAGELESMGVVQSVVPRAELMAHALGAARQLAELPAEALQWTKWAMNRMLHFSQMMSSDGTLGHQGWSFHLKPSRAVQSSGRFGWSPPAESGDA